MLFVVDSPGKISKGKSLSQGKFKLTYIGIILKCILFKFELSTPSRFQDIAVQNQQVFFFHFSVAILSVL